MTISETTSKVARSVEPLPTRQDVIEAAQRISGSVKRTRTEHSEVLSEMLNANVYCKYENHQYTGSFKERGARNRLLSVESGRGVVAMSAGNHAAGVARHGAQLGIATTIVMPENTPFIKVARTRDLGARVVLAGHDVMEAAAKAHELAETENLEFIHPFDDAKVIAGQGTIAIEMLEDVPDLDVIICAVGGGGLISGVALYSSGHHRNVEVVGVQSERYPSMADALARRSSTATAGTTVADGIAVSTAGTLTEQILRNHKVDIAVVSEESIERAVTLLLETEKTVVEGAGAAPLAACKDQLERFVGKNIGLVLCGGNIDPRTLSSVTLRGMARRGRLVRIRVELDDIPGRLATVSNIIAQARANVVQVDYDGLGSEGARSAILELRCDTLDFDHADEVLKALQDKGLAATIAPW